MFIWMHAKKCISKKEVLFSKQLLPKNYQLMLRQFINFTMYFIT